MPQENCYPNADGACSEEFLGYVICPAFATLVYHWVLAHLLPVEPSIPNTAVVGAIAQLASKSALWLLQRIAGIDVPHSQQCHLWTCGYVVIASAVNTSSRTAALLVLVTMVLIPRRWLWFPTAKSKAKIRACDLQSVAPTSS
jgi:hypothetical protein